MRRVIVESPFAGDVRRNLRYLRAAMRDCLLRGEAPFASHALYTQPGVLDDDKPEDRKLGMNAGWEWMGVADEVCVYTDLGITPGMQAGIQRAEAYRHNVVYRTLGPDWDKAPEYPTRWE